MESTTDYDMFYFLKENRNISDLKSRRLAALIKENNFLKENPIIVKKHETFENKFAVLDGQHRLTAARDIGVPVYYIVSDHMEMLDVPMLNNARCSWTAKDYLNYYVGIENNDYKILQFLVDKYGFSIRSTLQVSGKLSSCSHAYALFKEGGFVVSDVSQAKEILETITDFKPFFSSFKNRHFVTAVLICIRSGKYNRKKMQQKMEYLSRKLVKCPDTLTYVEMLEEIFNHNQTRSQSVSFLNGYLD
jgi:hypothetical protein